MVSDQPSTGRKVGWRVYKAFDVQQCSEHQREEKRGTAGMAGSLVCFAIHERDAVMSLRPVVSFVWAVAGSCIVYMSDAVPSACCDECRDDDGVKRFCTIDMIVVRTIRKTSCRLSQTAGVPLMRRSLLDFCLSNE